MPVKFATRFMPVFPAPPETAEISVNNFPLFNATVGEAGNKVAVKILDTVFEEDIK